MSEIPLTEDTIKYAYVDNDGNAEINLRDYITTDIELNKYSYPPKFENIGHIVSFDNLKTAEELIDYIANTKKYIENKKQELQPKLKAAIEAYDASQAEKEKLQAIKAEETKQREEKQEAEKKLLIEEKKNWIENYGSEALKLAFKYGYDCQRQYVTERSKIDFPEFSLDFDDESDWKERTMPSTSALQQQIELLNKGYNAVVVWLTNAPECVNGFYGPCEALIIRNYLKNNLLLKLF